jgi:hypothetical protein
MQSGLEELVRAMAHGDRTALSRVYEQTVAQVFAIARSATSPEGA